MLWEELRADQFERACIETGGTCIVPMGVIEKHGLHLPIGTDMMIGRGVAEKAAKIEPAVVFPYYFFGQIAEARHVPGTISIDHELMYRLLENVLDEIARNGFRKLILLNSHGGNSQFINYFVQSTLHRKKDYVVYAVNLMADSPDMAAKKEEILETRDFGDHAGNYETAMVMALRPELVNMDHIETEGINSYGLLDHFKDPGTGANDIYTGIWWYADHPTHFAGDPSSASVAKGERILDLVVRNTARKIKTIKEDTVAERLLKEFYEKADKRNGV